MQTKHLTFFILTRNKDGVGAKPSSIFTDHSKAVILLWILIFVCVSCLSVMQCCPYFVALKSPVWKGLNSWLSCVFVTFLYDVIGQVWYMIVSIPNLCLLPCFNKTDSR